MTAILGLDIGSNSVGSAWIEGEDNQVVTGVSVFPAGVEETEEKRGDPKSAKRRSVRRTRITLARRSERKRHLRVKLIDAGLLPAVAICPSCATGKRSSDGTCCYKSLLEATDPWDLRCRGLDDPLSPFQFGRVLLHLAQRRGTLGLHIPDPDIEDEENSAIQEEGKVKKAIGAMRARMLESGVRTFGEYIDKVRRERVSKIASEDLRPVDHRKGPREWRTAIRNKAASYEHCADRAMIRHEFATLWERQASFSGDTAKLLTPELRIALDNESADGVWRHKGLLFGQRRQSWDLGSLGRCTLHPEERCVPHADMYASRFLVVETINNLRIIETGKEARPLTPEEREKIKAYLSGPLGIEKGTKKRPGDRPKRTVSVTDLRNLMGTASDGWGRASKTARFHFTIENDEERPINTDWFSREIIHGAVTPDRWASMTQEVREGINRAILKCDPEHEEDARKLKAGVMTWAGLTEAQADALITAWRTRPKTDAKRLNMGRRAVRNLLAVMDRPEPWPDADQPSWPRWLTQIEARKHIARGGDFADLTTGQPIDGITRRRYATGAKGATARDRYYMRKHVLCKAGQPVVNYETGEVLKEPPPAPLITNPVVRKAIHEVRRHLVEYMKTFGRKPDEVYIELAREARMGKMDADRLLFRNRLRNRIRNEIIQAYQLESRTSTQQRAAVDRVILCVQQNQVCPLCGHGGITPHMAAQGEDCEVAHIIPRASGGHNGLSNIVLAHTRCNREMGRRTPREYWSQGSGFEQGMVWVEGIYGNVLRPKPSEMKGASGASLWAGYFNKRDDTAKIEQFKKNITDIQEMTPRQEAATTYATRQIMAYLADALYDGRGLPERSTGTDQEDNKRRIFTINGLWTSRLRREWGLFFDPHAFRTHGLNDAEGHLRKEKDRGDHRHHAIDAIIIAQCTAKVQRAWDERERQADRDGVNTADEEAMENYRRLHPLDPPTPFRSREEFRNAVRQAVFGDGSSDKPVCHRPVKRKLIGALHEETLFGPVLGKSGELTDSFTAKKSVLSLEPNHLRMPRPETRGEAIDRLAARRQRLKEIDARTARKWARDFVTSPGYTAAIVDPSPGKSGIVRDVALRRRLRTCLENERLNPDDFSANDIKKLYEDGHICQASGVPIRSVVLMRTMSDPVIASRWATDYSSGHRMRLYDAGTHTGSATAARAYLGGNNHHIEIRVDTRGKWSGVTVSAYEAAQRNLARLRASRQAGIPVPKELRRLSADQRRQYAQLLRQIEQAHPLVDRHDDEAKGERFVMSLSEGEMLYMKHKHTGEPGYFVVAKLDKPQTVVLVPHWDARAATERKDTEGRKVQGSEREQFSATPSDLQGLAPPGHEHAVKVRVTPLGRILHLKRD